MAIDRLLWLGAAALLAGCAHRSTTAHHVVPPRSLQPAFERQVRNAVDAGEGDVAVRELRRKVMANPDDARSRMDLAARYHAQGVPELAVEHLRIAIARAPHLSEPHLQLARVLHATGDTAGAAETLARFCSADPLPPVELVSLLGIYQDDLGLHPEAEVQHRRAVALAPQRDSLRNNLGYNLLLQGKPAAAVSEFRRAVALNPRSEIARNNLGTALALAPGGDLEQAVLQWQSVSDPATAHNNLASILIDQKRFPEARRELEIALGYSRHHAAALGNLALLAELDGQPASVALPARANARHRWILGRHKSRNASRPEPGSAPALAAAAKQ